MKTSMYRSCFLLLVILLGSYLPARATTYVVTNTNDSGTGSLRSAMQAAEANSNTTGADLITFNISGAGVHTIVLASTLPTVTEAVTINGYSQPGSQANTSSTADNAVLQIAITGDGNSSFTPFTVYGSNCAFKGLAIYSLSSAFSLLSAAATGNHIEGCFIGTDATGTRKASNALGGIGILNGASGNVIGGTTPAARNVIVGNGYRGIDVGANGGPTPHDNVIAGNFIGIDATGATALGNGDGGIQISDATKTIIGGTSAGAGNLIAGNSAEGIRILGTKATSNVIQGNLIGTNASGASLGNGTRGVLFYNGATGNNVNSGNVIANNADAGVALYYEDTIHNAIRGNSIYGNGGSGIKLINTTYEPQNIPRPNEALDADTGPDNGQNWPIVTSVAGSAVGGTLDSLPNTTFVIDIYGNDTVDASGFGEGRYFLGSVSNVKTDAAGHATWSFTVPGGAKGDGQSFSATATTAGGDTSEFGPSGASGVVTNTNDSGGGSLRNAIIIANQLPGTTIIFNIPTTDPNYTSGVFTIKPTTPLPAITADGTIIEGGSEKDFVSGLNAAGPAIILNGVSIPINDFSSGLTLNASHCAIRGLVVNGFVRSSGILIVGGIGGTAVLTDNAVESCYLGTNSSGNRAVPNANGLTIDLDGFTTGSGVNGCTIGGVTSSQRNLIAGNANYGILLSGATIFDITVSGNFIGVDRTAANALANGDASIGMGGGTHDNIVGGTASGTGNVIVAINVGVRIDGSGTNNNLIQGNAIGTNAAASQTIGIGGGVSIDSGAQNNTIGGTSSGAANIIAGNQAAITIGTASNNVVQGNFLGTNRSGAALGNQYGVRLADATSNLIGGTGAGMGNVIGASTSAGIDLAGTKCQSNTIQGNLIGVAPDGKTALPNTVGVALEYGASSNLLGGTAAGAGNIISGNTEGGVHVNFAGTTGNLIQGNTIGTDATGLPLGNGTEGILLQYGAISNIIGAAPGATGTAVSAAGNHIADNGADGIGLIHDETTGNTIRGNAIAGNGGLGINLRPSDGSGSGVNSNDSADKDSGPNLLQNFPLISDIAVANGKTVVTGTLNSTPGATFILDLYGNTVAEPGGFGEGASYLASQTVQTDSKGDATFSFSLNGTSFGDLLTLTATNSTTGDTSEFSPQGAPGVVTNTLDSGPGSLRNALTLAQTLGGSTIRFSIPATDPGFKNGVFTISPLTPLPAVSADYTVVDGNTQTTFGGNTNTKGPEIALDGGKAPASAAGLTLTAAHCTVQGLSIGRFATGINISFEPASYNTVSGCYLGISADGTTAAANDTGIFLGYGPHDTLIGGTSSSARNVIAGNTTVGIQVQDDVGSKMARNVIAGNYIGLTASGAAPLGNGQSGIALGYGSTGTTIGGTSSSARNVIAGNGRAGIALTSSSGHRIVGNYIGTNAAGTEAVPNGSGIVVYGGTNTIGGVASGESNRIAFNRFYGIEVQADSSATDSHITMRGNAIYSNGSIGIDLLGGKESFYGGVTLNDDAAQDADTGPNGLQNYPVISGFSASGGTTTIRGTLTSVPNHTYAIDFYRVTRPDDSGYGEGDSYLGSSTVNTDAQGQTSFSFSGNFSGQYFSATATDTASGDTSEFSSASVSVQITSFSPKIGPVGTTVTLKGGSFTGTTSVSFGTTSATWKVSSDGSTLTATVPAGARTDPIHVTTPVGTAQTDDDFVVTPPFNDNFSQALTIQAFGGGLTGYNRGATKEIGEPDHAAPGGASVWYRWQPAFTGQASVGVADSDFDTLLAVYTGTKVSALQLVAANNNAGRSNRSAVSFAVTGGNTYYIALDGANGAQGRFVLQWTLANKAPANDNFVSAQLIEGDNSRTYGTNLLATRETGEPLHAAKDGHTSVWYSWQPSQSGFASFSTQGSTIDTLLAVYTGDSLGTLRTIASNDDSEGSTSRVSFSAVGGVVYKIAVDGFSGAQGDLVLTGNLSVNQSTISWTGNGGDGLWSNPANWNLIRIPRSTDTVAISKSGNYTVTLDIDASVGGLILGSATSNAVKPLLLIQGTRSLTFNDSTINKNATLSLAGGTLHSNSDLEIRGLFDWTGGTWTGYRAYIAAGALLDIHGDALKTLLDIAITNLGLIRWRDGGNIAGGNGASILNQKNFEIQNDASLIWDGKDKQPSFLNDRGALLVKRRITTGTNSIGWIFGNDGQVSLEAGILSLEGGGVSYGDFDIATGARINVAQDYVFDKQTSRFTGGGFAAVVNGTTGFDIGVTATNFEFSQGQIEGKDDLSVSKNFLWTGGTMTEGGTTTMASRSLMAISGATAKAIAQRNLVNNGTINWNEGSIQADDGAKISNNGSFNCVVGTKFTYRKGQKLEFNNAKGAKLTGSTTISGNVTNLGRIQPLNTLRLGGGGLAAADVNDGGGLINITGDMLQGSGAQIDIVINGTLDPQTHQPLYGQLLVGGVVNLQSNCGLTVTSPNYTLKKGDEFKVLRALSIQGDFSTIAYPQLPANLAWSATKVAEPDSTSYVLKVMEKTPVISSFTPTSGIAGTLIAINGQNLGSANAIPTINFGSIKVAPQSVTATQLKVLIPDGAKTGRISVTTGGGTVESNQTLLIRPVIISFSPTMGAKGQVILLKGTNLVNAATPKPIIKFNQTIATASDLISASATQLKVRVPISATNGIISVTTSDGSAVTGTTFTFLAPPQITSLPATGAIGATIIIKGQNFINANTTKPIVKFGSRVAPSDSITSVSKTQFKVVVPVGAKTGKITVQTSGGFALSTNNFVIQ